MEGRGEIKLGRSVLSSIFSYWDALMSRTLFISCHRKQHFLACVKFGFKLIRTTIKATASTKHHHHCHHYHHHHHRCRRRRLRRRSCRHHQHHHHYHHHKHCHHHHHHHNHNIRVMTLAWCTLRCPGFHLGFSVCFSLFSLPFFFCFFFVFTIQHYNGSLSYCWAVEGSL